MSRVDTITFTCPSCNKEHEMPYWQSLNSSQNPVEVAKLMDGTLFEITCPHCGHKTGVSYPVLYHDQHNAAMIYLLPSNNESDIEKAVALFNQQQGLKDNDYKFRIVRNQNELREKAIIFHHHLDDGVLEIVKIVYLIQMQKKYPDVEIAETYYLRGENDEHVLCFIAGDGTQYSAVVDDGLYNEVGSDYNDAIKTNSVNCYEINRTWAQGLLFN